MAIPERPVTIPEELLLGGEPLEPAYSEDGVDLTLIRWMLSLTPSERLDVLESHVREILAIRALDRAT